MKYLKKYKLFESSKFFNFRNCSGLIGRNIFDQFVYQFYLSEEEYGCGGDANAVNINGVSMLQQAVYYLDLEIVKYLLEKGADPNKQTHRGETPILELGRRFYDDIKNNFTDLESIKILKELLKYDGDLNHRNGEGLDFFDLIKDKIKIDKIKTYIPEEYKKYIRNKQIKKFKI